jgi:hypothetical protein
MKSSALALLLLAAPLQDPRDGGQEIDDLRSECIERRACAAARLQELGPRAYAALDVLQADADPEVRARAAAIRDRIALQERERHAYGAPAPLEIPCGARTLGDVLDALARGSGVTLHADASVRDRAPRGLGAASSLFEYLDRLCAGEGDLTWSYADDGGIRLGPGEPRSAPSVYVERFRFSLPRLEALRITEEGRTQVILGLHIEALREKSLEPLGPPAITLEVVEDDAGARLTCDAPVVPRTVEEPAADAETVHRKAWILYGASAGARRLAHVSGHVAYYFALRRLETTVGELDRERTETVGPLQVRIAPVRPGALLVTLEPRDPAAARPTFLDVRSVSVEDAAGAVWAPASCQVHVLAPRPTVTQYLIVYDPAAEGPAKTLTFSVVTEALEKKLPFTFRDVPLP